jgi:GNAT superfamily N-acetyltransferase
MIDNSEDVHVRTLSDDDCDAASRLISEIISDLSYYSSHAREAEISKYSPSRLRDLIRLDARSVLIASRQSRLVGFLVSTYDDGVIWLAWFGVRKEERSTGVGSRLLKTAISQVRERGCAKIWCDTRTENVESGLALERAGFERLCRIDRHWYGLDFFLWEKIV